MRRAAIAMCMLRCLATGSSDQDSTCSEALSSLQAAPEAAHVLLQRARLVIDVSADSGVGGTAPLDDRGFLEVAETCCNLQMLRFFRRAIDEMALEVCDEAGLADLVPFFTCEHTGTDKWPYPYYTGSFGEMRDSLFQRMQPTKCGFVAPVGNCAPKDHRLADEPFPVQDEHVAACQSKHGNNLDWWNWGGHCSKATTSGAAATSNNDFRS